VQAPQPQCAWSKRTFCSFVVMSEMASTAGSRIVSRMACAAVDLANAGTKSSAGLTTGADTLVTKRHGNALVTDTHRELHRPQDSDSDSD
jgi:hypothetical protein